MFQVEDVETKRKKIKTNGLLLTSDLNSLHTSWYCVGIALAIQIFPIFYSVETLSGFVQNTRITTRTTNCAYKKSKHYHYQILSLLIFSQLFKVVKGLLSGWLTFRDKSLFFAKGGGLEDFGSIPIK